MASWRRQYLYTARYPTTGLYRLTGLWPLFSESPCYVRLSDDEGGAVEYVSQTGSSELNQMVGVDLSFPFSAEPGDRILTLDAVLPDDASSAAAWVRFTVEIDRLRVWDGIHTYRPECYETNPPEIFGPNSFDVMDRWSCAYSAKVINLLYENENDVVSVVQEWAGPEAETVWIPDEGEAGQGLIAAKTGNAIWIWLIGTQTTGQLIEQTLNFNSGPTSTGRYSSAAIWLRGMRSAIEAIEDLGLDGVKKITVSGHSMGGAIACCLAGMLDHSQPSIRVDVLTFGCPRPGDQRLIDMLARRRCNHIVTRFDPIPALPPHRGQIPVPIEIAAFALVPKWEQYRPLSSYTTLENDGALLMGGLQPMLDADLAAALSALLGGDVIAGGDAHSLITYERLLRTMPP